MGWGGCFFRREERRSAPAKLGSSARGSDRRSFQFRGGECISISISRCTLFCCGGFNNEGATVVPRVLPAFDAIQFFTMETPRRYDIGVYRVVRKTRHSLTDRKRGAEQYRRHHRCCRVGYRRVQSVMDLEFGHGTRRNNIIRFNPFSFFLSFERNIGR